MTLSPQPNRRRDRLGAWGFGCLALTSLGSALAGTFLLIAGIGNYLNAPQASISSDSEARAFLHGLEGSVIQIGVATLAFLLALATLVILLKELSDDVRRERRGSIG